METWKHLILVILLDKSLNKEDRQREIAMIANMFKPEQFDNIRVVPTTHGAMAKAVGECIVDERTHKWRSEMPCKYSSIGFLIESDENESPLYHYTK